MEPEWIFLGIAKLVRIKVLFIISILHAHKPLLPAVQIKYVKDQLVFLRIVLTVNHISFVVQKVTAWTIVLS